jgi:hypothetical protein
MVRSDLVDRDNLWSFCGCWGAEVNCENKHAILHLGVDVGLLAVYSPGHQGKQQTQKYEPTWVRGGTCNRRRKSPNFRSRFIRSRSSGTGSANGG